MGLKKEEITKMMKKFKNKYIKLKINENLPSTEETLMKLDNSDVTKKREMRRKKKKYTQSQDIKTNEFDSSNYVQSLLNLSDNIINISINKNKEKTIGSTNGCQEYEKMI